MVWKVIDRDCFEVLLGSYMFINKDLMEKAREIVSDGKKAT